MRQRAPGTRRDGPQVAAHREQNAARVVSPAMNRKELLVAALAIAALFGALVWLS
jgi:hypothetical protein